MTGYASPYTITRQNGQRDLEALRALVAGDGVAESDLRILHEIADRIAEQMPKPAIEEPKKFGSVVRVVTTSGFERRWCRTYSVVVDQPWCTGNHMGSWSDVIEDATDVEVLRVGVGEQNAVETEGFCTCYPNEKAPDCGISEHRREARIYRDPMDDAPEDERPDVVERVEIKRVVRSLARLHLDAITAPEKRCYETAGHMVAALLDES